MPPDQGFVEHVIAMLEPAGEISHKRMFGGVGVWEAGDMFAMISSESRLYLKVDEDTVKRYQEAGCEQFHSMPYWSAPAGLLDDPDRQEDWIDEAIEIGHATASTKRSKKKKGKNNS
jgi:DNA transformation protein